MLSLYFLIVIVENLNYSEGAKKKSLVRLDLNMQAKKQT
jgi:hypothetical protein